LPVVESEIPATAITWASGVWVMAKKAAPAYGASSVLSLRRRK
jgi:hypothetical protein